MSKIPVAPKFGDMDLVTSAEGWGWWGDGTGGVVRRKKSLNTERAKNKV